MSESRIRLLKLVVQPTFVLDNGPHLREVPVQPIQVNAEEWEKFAKEGLAEVEADVLKQLASE